MSRRCVGQRRPVSRFVLRDFRKSYATPAQMGGPSARTENPSALITPRHRTCIMSRPRDTTRAKCERRPRCAGRSMRLCPVGKPLQPLDGFGSNAFDYKEVIPPGERPLAGSDTRDPFCKYRTNTWEENKRVLGRRGEEQKRVPAIIEGHDLTGPNAARARRRIIRRVSGNRRRWAVHLPDGDPAVRNVIRSGKNGYNKQDKRANDSSHHHTSTSRHHDTNRRGKTRAALVENRPFHAVDKRSRRHQVRPYRLVFRVCHVQPLNVEMRIDQPQHQF